MHRALLISVRFHDGRYHGLDEQQQCERPPAPARLFQALMAGAASATQESGQWTRALDWLETMDPPAIAAPRAKRGVRYENYVPNNDVDAVLRNESYEEAVKKTLLGKRIQPMLFDQDSPIVYRWDLTPNEEEQAEAVCRLSRKLYQLGRTVDMAYAQASIVDAEEADRQCRADHQVVHLPSGDAPGGNGLFCPSPGLRRSLTESFGALRHRLREDETTGKPLTAFVHPPKPPLQVVRYGARPKLLVFELRPPNRLDAYAPWRLQDAAKLVSTARDEAARHLSRTTPDPGNLIGRQLTGREAGSTDKSGRIRIIPIPSVGHPESDHMVRRLAVEIPSGCELRTDDIAWAFEQVAWKDEDDNTWCELRRTESSDMVRRFEKRSTRWRSSTPLALPLRPCRKGPKVRAGDNVRSNRNGRTEYEETIDAVRDALRHAGVHEAVTGIVAQRTAFDPKGLKAQAFGPSCRFETRALWHVSFACAEGLEGPLLLGDGRYVGLGLMRPVLETPSVLQFSITGGLKPDATAKTVAMAARRAMMARVQARMQKDALLPTYVSGHEPDGRPAGRNERHEHVAVVADLPRSRLLFIAPSELDRRNTQWWKLAAVHARMAQALQAMDMLLTKDGAKLKLRPSMSDPERDPLLRPSRMWETVTPYYVTRHRKRMSADEAVRQDIQSELARCGWPRVKPDRIQVLQTRIGAKGALSAHVRIAFSKAEPGPLLIGRTAHKGGGLFAGSDPDDR